MALSEPIRVSPEEAEAVNELVSGAFGYPPEQYFFDDFPVWNSTEVVRLGIWDKDHLVSHVGYRFVEVTPQLKVALIGAVATSASFRGKGLVTQLLSKAISEIDQAGCDFSILWGSEHGFYSKFGFELSGIQERALLIELDLHPSFAQAEDQKLKHPSEQAIVPGINDDILSALEESPIGVRLKAADRTWLTEHRSVKWFSTTQPFAYLAFERGLDLQHMVHEWGGDSLQLKRLFHHVSQIDPSAQIIGPDQSLKTLGFTADEILSEHLCLARPHPFKPKLLPDDFWISGMSAC